MCFLSPRAFVCLFSMQGMNHPYCKGPEKNNSPVAHSSRAALSLEPTGHPTLPSPSVPIDQPSSLPLSSPTSNPSSLPTGHPSGEPSSFHPTDPTPRPTPLSSQSFIDRPPIYYISLDQKYSCPVDDGYTQILTRYADEDHSPLPFRAWDSESSYVQYDDGIARFYNERLYDYVSCSADKTNDLYECRSLLRRDPVEATKNTEEIQSSNVFDYLEMNTFWSGGMCSA